MNPRQRILATLRRQQPDRVPYDIRSFNREAWRIFREKTGSDDPSAHFGAQIDVADFGWGATKLDVFERYARYFPRLSAERYARHLPEKPAQGTWYLSDWGFALVVGSNPAYDHFEAPLANATSLSEIEDYPLPDLDAAYRHAHLEETVKRAHDAQLASVGHMAVTIFETAWHIRGLTEILMDFATQPEWADCICERITQTAIFRARRFAEAGVDVLFLGDDVGMEDRMMMSPATWRRFLKERLARVIAAAREVKPDVIVAYHTDGFVEPIIGEFIEIGIDVLNPVQPECMDPAKLKARYGDRLAFWGTLGIQHTLPFGTPEDVAAEVKLRIETVGRGGGLYLAPTHAIAPEVPHENLFAFVEAAKKYGRYA